MKNITAAMMFVLVIFAIFFEAEAGVIDKKYDTASGDTIVRYQMKEGDSPWKIHGELISGPVTMEAVEKRIMTPNNITDPRTIGINVVLVIRGNDFKDPSPKEVALTEDSPVAENQNPVAMNEEKSPAPKERQATFVDQFNVSDKNMIMVSTENKLPVEKYETNADLQRSLKVALAKIGNLEKMIVDKDNRILALEKAQAVKFEEKIIKPSKKNLEEAVQIKKNVLEPAVARYNQTKKMWMVVSLCIGVPLAACVFFWMTSDFRKHSHEEKYWTSKRIKRKIKKFVEPKPVLSSSS